MIRRNKSGAMWAALIGPPATEKGATLGDVRVHSAECVAWDLIINDPNY